MTQYQPEKFHFLTLSACPLLSRPAPPSSLTSTAPPRPWGDISQPRRYSLSGNSHIAPSVLLLCLCFCCACSCNHRVNLVPIYSPTPNLSQQRLHHRRLQAEVFLARRRAGPAEELHPEQRHGLQRLSAVSVRAGPAGNGLDVYRTRLLEDVFESLAEAQRLRKCVYFAVTLKSDAGSKHRNHRLQGVLQHMTNYKMWARVCRCSACAYVRVS